MIDLSDLISTVEPEEAYQTELTGAAALGLTTSTWQSGDPTRTTFRVFGSLVSLWSKIAVNAIKGGLLDYSSGGWLTLLAPNMHGVSRIPQTAATCTVRLTNAGGGVYPITAGAITVAASSTGKTYRTQNTGTLNALDTLDLTVLAEEPGSDSSAGIGEIDTLVSPTLIGVTVANTTVAVGSDEETDAELKIRCRESLAALSPDGPSAAYAFIARSALRTDGTAIGVTRVRVSSADGEVTVLLADPDGAPEPADVDRIDDLIQTQVVPLGVTATVSAASGSTIAIVYTAFVPTATGASDAEIKAQILTSLEQYFATIPIGGFPTAVPATGKVYHDLLRARISDAVAEIFSVTLSTPPADVSMTSSTVGILGTVTGTITRYDP